MMSFNRLVSLLIILALPAIACGLTNPKYLLNNEIRLAVYEYEREVRGPVDDLVIDFKRDEPRIKFEGQNENGRHTVWLYRLGAREYFATRPQQATYLYIQEIEYNDDYSLSTVKVYRGDATGYQERQLGLRKAENEGWVITEDVKIGE